MAGRKRRRKPVFGRGFATGDPIEMCGILGLDEIPHLRYPDEVVISDSPRAWATPYTKGRMGRLRRVPIGTFLTSPTPEEWSELPIDQRGLPIVPSYLDLEDGYGIDHDPPRILGVNGDPYILPSGQIVVCYGLKIRPAFPCAPKGTKSKTDVARRYGFV